MSKVCNKCLADKPLSEYHKQANTPDGRRYTCKACVSQYMRGKFTDKHYAQKQRQNSARYKYGIDWPVVVQMFETQGGSCKICSRTLSLEVNGRDRTKAVRIDHCHSTGAVRGLLCDWCNNGLGKFFDSPALLKAAATYLEAQ